MVRELLDFFIRNQSFLLSLLLFAPLLLTTFKRWGRTTHKLEDLRRLILAPLLLFLAIVISATGTVSLFGFGDGKLVPPTIALALPEPTCTPHRTTAASAVVFIHGWNGDAQNTWGRFPELACRDADVRQV